MQWSESLIVERSAADESARCNCRYESKRISPFARLSLPFYGAQLMVRGSATAPHWEPIAPKNPHHPKDTTPKPELLAALAPLRKRIDRWNKQSSTCWRNS